MNATPAKVKCAVMAALLLLPATAQAQAIAPAPPPVITKLYTSDIIVDAQGQESSTQHIEMQAANAAAAQQMGQLPLAYSDTMEELDVTEAYTLKSDGRKLPVAPSAIFTQLPQGASQEPMFDDQRQKTIVFPDVEAGDTIVVGYTRHGKQAYIPGQYFNSYVFSRSAAYGDAHGSITAPKSLPLNVEAHDIALDKKDNGDTVTYTWHYSAPARQEVDSAVLSAFDRSPRLLASSFKTYDDFVRAYAPLVAPKMAITAGVQALADQITAGSTDHRQQAEKIYNWVSQHIRYVGIELGTGGIVPHDAAQILANGYGDCKDHVVLFAALLKAKGIDSEMVLINLGNSYTLPDTPGIGELNHAITWIPEFKLYADTTAGVAPFGVLPFQEYGKPVVHVSAVRPALRHVPVLAGGVAAVAYTTTAHIDDKGNLVGQTRTATTGPFAIALRQAGQSIQAAGAERVATYLLQKAEIPGTATISAPPVNDGGNAYAIDTTFSIGPYPSILAGQGLIMPWQMELQGRPGDLLAGPLANMTIKDSDPTPCYSGHTSEDITLDPPAGRKFLNPPSDKNSDSAHISFKSHWSLTGQSMTLHREVTTKFDTALCSDAVRVEAARMLATIRDDLDVPVGLAAAPSPTQDKLSADAQAADNAMRQGDYAKAVTLDTAMLTDDVIAEDRKWYVYYGRAAANLALKQYAPAIADYSAAIALNKTNPELYRFRAQAYAAQQDWDHAIADLTSLIAFKPGDANVVIARGAAYLGKKDFDHAIADYTEALRLAPQNTQALNVRGNAYWNKKDYDNALADYSSALKIDPSDAGILNSRGNIYRIKGDYAAAIADETAALKLQPTNPLFLGQRGEYYARAGNYDSALADLSEAIRIKPDLGQGYSDRGIVYFRKQSFDLALADFATAIRLLPNYANARIGRGRLYMAKHDYDSAMIDFNEAMRLDPNSADAVENRGFAYAGKHDYDHAIADYNQALKLQPDNTLSLVGRAEAYSRKGQYDMAISDEDAALKRMPNFVLALNGRCWNRALANKDLDSALSDCNAALKQAPTNVNYLDSRGFVYFRMGKMDLARADYDAALAPAAKALTLYKRGLLKNRMGDADGGKADIAAALAMDPHAGDDMTALGLTP